MNKRDHLRQELLEAFGGKCSMCGYDKHRSALCIDHVYGDGFIERKRFTPTEYYENIYTNRDSGRYQILCMNCNALKRIWNKENRGRGTEEDSRRMSLPIAVYWSPTKTLEELLKEVNIVARMKSKVMQGYESYVIGRDSLFVEIRVLSGNVEIRQQPEMWESFVHNMGWDLSPEEGIPLYPDSITFIPRT